jgi:hypothetical protein
MNKNDNGKPDITLLGAFHPKALEAVVRVLEYGARKYGRDNWKSGVDTTESIRRFEAALGRHYLKSIQCTNPLDEETMLEHEAHIVVNALFSLSLKLWDEGVPE